MLMIFSTRVTLSAREGGWGGKDVNLRSRIWGIGREFSTKPNVKY
jgi:hypothetical protein